uniref:Evasin n=1 Tax=Rhipicephalus microplus TaxID=6941 RepID=A0A6G5A1C5_RHIMP
MRILWHLYLLIGLVAAGDEHINHVPGCEDVPTASKKRPHPHLRVRKQHHPLVQPRQKRPHPQLRVRQQDHPLVLPRQKLPQEPQQLRKGAREKYEPKYGYYRDYYGCIYTVLTSRQLLYHALCTYTCPWYPYVYRVRDGVTCLTILEKGAQERTYRDSKVCRKGRCFNGLCMPTSYVQSCSVPNTFPRNLPRNALDRSE